MGGCVQCVYRVVMDDQRGCATATYRTSVQDETNRRSLACCRIMSAPSSPVIIAGALVFTAVIRDMVVAPITRAARRRARVTAR
ncbi:hypothetical protein BZM26_00295 [Paraburkholderia strydomiana]|nr:hypothetical protein BZM26_00295 [Paraburkholderia strydomiana]